MSMSPDHQVYEHPSRKRSVFARKGMGSRKKLPPATGTSNDGVQPRKMSMFRSPSYSSGRKKNKSPMSQKQTKPHFWDTSSITSSETRNSTPTAAVVTPPPSCSTAGSSRSTRMDLLSPIQSKVTVLRQQQVQDTGSTSKRSELLMGQVKVLEEESHRKDEKLRELNDKLHHIQIGLSDINEARETLQRQVKQLEQEKRNIHQQLDLREAEVLTLVKRCASQEEKVKESTLLRCKNTELEKEIEELRSVLAKREDDETSLDATIQELQACQHRLEHTKRDHDSLAGTLQTCLANIKKLTNEKQEWEDERRRLLNRAEVEIEKERLQHLGELNEIKIRLQNRQDKVEKLEEFMKDKSMTNLMLRKANAELTKWKTQTSLKLEEYERQISELEEENKESQEAILATSGNSGSWETKIQEKEDLISSLQGEVACYMTRAMTISATVEVLQDENEELEDMVDDLKEKVKSFHDWEEERDAMMQCLSVTQDQIQELMEEVVTLQLENDELQEQNLELQEGAKSQADIQNLEKHISDKQLSWKELEENLRSKIASLESEKIVMQEGIDTKLKHAQENIRTLEWTVASRTKDTVSLQNELDEARETEAASLNQIKSLESNLSTAIDQREKFEVEAKELRCKALAMESEMDATKGGLNEFHDEIARLKAALENKEKELLNAHESLLISSKGSSEIILQLENKLEATTRELSDASRANAELERATKTTATNANNRVMDLESQLGSKEEELKREIQNRETLIDELKAKLADAEQSEEERTEISALQLELADSRAKQTELEEKLATKESELSEASNSILVHQGESQALKAEITKVQTDLAIKDDEIRELRLCELVDLEEEVSSLRDQLTTKTSENGELIVKLDALSVAQLERELEVSEEVNSLKATISLLKKEYQQTENDWLLESKDALQELKANTGALQRRNQLLEKSVQSIKNEKDLILASEKRLEATLQSELSRKQEITKELQEYKTRNEALETSMATMNAQKAEFEKAKEEKDDLLEALSREQNIREVVEAEVSTVYAQLALLKNQMKENESLRSENSELTDKVKQLEAFQNKIQKERVQRDRSSLGNVLKAPVRLDASRKSLLTAPKPVDLSRSENIDPNRSVIRKDGPFAGCTEERT